MCTVRLRGRGAFTEMSSTVGNDATLICIVLAVA